MSYARQMLDSYPRTVSVDASVLAAAIDRSATVLTPAKPTPTLT